MKILSDLSVLMRIHSIAPKVVEESVSQDQNYIKKGVKPFFKGIADLESVIQNVMLNTRELNRHFAEEIQIS